MDRLKVDLTKDDILKSLILFAIPILISNIFQQLYNTIDTMIVGNFLGDEALAAMGASGAVFELIIGFSLGVGNGLSVVVARNYGSGDEQKLKKSVFGSIMVGLVMTMLVMIFSKYGLYPLLELLDTPASIIEETHSYIYTITMFVGVAFAYNLCAGFLRAIGNSVMPLIFLIISSIINIVLDIIFITQLQMGVQGAAVATVIAQAISAILSIIYIMKKEPILVPNRTHMNVEKELYQDLAGQGLSMGMMIAIVSTGTVILQKAINSFGTQIIAGHTVARKTGSFFSMPVATMAATVSTFVSQNKGADHKDRIIIGIKTGSKLVIAWSLFATLIIFTFGQNLIILMSGSSDPQLINTATSYLRFNGPFYAVLGILLILRSSLQGLGQKIVPLISSVIEFFAKILFSIFIIPKLGYWGVIICEPIIWVLMCLQLFFAIYRNPYLNEKELVKE